MSERPIRVLLVEDDEEEYALTRDHLAEIGGEHFHLDRVRTFDEGRASIQRREYDVYLIDPEGVTHGDLDLLRQVSAEGGHVPIVMLAGRGRRERDIEALRAGAAYYLAKTGASDPRLDILLRDTLDLEQTQQALRQSEEYTRAVLESAVDGMITIDENGIIETFNRAAAFIFGYSAEEAVGRSVSLLMPPPYRDEHDDYIRRYLRTGEKRVIGIGREVVGQRRDGTVIPLDLAISEVKVRGARRFLGIVRDISERKRAEEALRQAEALAQQRARLADIGAITAQIVHDIGNPVAGVVMQANAILRSLDRDPPPSVDVVRRQVERVLSTAHTLDKLVKEFLDFSREQRLERRLLDLSDFLHEVSAAWQPMAAQRDISLSVSVDSPVPPLPADEDKLRRVLDNLVKNALEAIDRGPGRVMIRASVPEPESVRLSVADTGPGIQPSIDPFRLFETTKPQGTGLGLAIVNQIIQAHEGRITVVPNKPHGAVFHVDLPSRPRGR
jgi:two-component system sensor kinase FixL